MADRNLLRVAETEIADQVFCWHYGERVTNPDMDRPDLDPIIEVFKEKASYDDTYRIW